MVVSDLAHQGSSDGDEVAEMVGDNVPVDEVAAAADTISYEILTALGRRYERVYVD